MDSTNRSKIFNLFLFSVFVLLVSVFLIYNYLGDRFAARNANADNTPGNFVYQQPNMQFAPYGEILGRDRYVATSANDYYQPAGYKALIGVKFTTANLPLGSAVRFCVARSELSGGAETDLICDQQNLETNSTASWQFSPSFGVILEPNSRYYCEVSIEVVRQDAQAASRYQAATSSCELETDSIESKDKLALSLSANGFTTWKSGANLHSGLEYSTSKQLNILQIYTAVAADLSLNEQLFTDICLLVDGNKQACAEGYTAYKGVDGRYSKPLWGQGQKITAAKTFTSQCRTQQGRDGSCLSYLFLEVDKGEIQALEGDILDRAAFYTTNSASVDKYCETNSFLFQNDYSFVNIGSNRQVERCKAILSSSNY